MKARDKKTGEIVDVYHEPQHGQKSLVYKEAVFVNGRMWTENELEFIDTPKAEDAIDWEQRRYEIAKEFLPNAAIAVNADPKEWMDGMSYPKASAIFAINYADALIEELKKKKE